MLSSKRGEGESDVLHLPFRAPGRFYRGNLHTHSTASDGTLSPAETIATYRQAGYDFVAITDHFMERHGFPITDTTALRSREFTTLLGAELHAPGLRNDEIWHILAVGLPLGFVPPVDGETGPQLASRAIEAGAFVGIAHPVWYGLTLDEVRSVDAAHAIEIYNETCVAMNDRGDSWSVLDMLLTEGRRLSAFGSDDAHFIDGRPDAFGAWVWVRSESLDPDALLAALKAGQYYTSQGPLIHDIAIDDNREVITISCSPAASIYATGPYWSAGAKHGRGIIDATFSLQDFNGAYCRVTVVDANGKRAWSNPIWPG